MGWPSWLFWRTDTANDENDNNDTTARPTRSTTPTSHQPTRPIRSWEDSLNKTDWSHYTTPQTIGISIITTLTTLALIRLYKTYLRRIPTVDHLKPETLHRRSVYGYVTSVGDGDNFRLFHTPGGRLMGWGWLGKSRRIQSWGVRGFKDKTMSIRIAGVDAPEAAHFGRPAQPFSQEALDWLRATVLNRFVRVWPYRHDQYGRVVCSVYRRRWLFFQSDIGLEMLKRGLATVYEAKFGSEFGNKEKEYYEAEERAKARKVGMWAEPGLVSRMLGKKKKPPLETPREYKTRMKLSEAENKSAPP